jgi:hypothetical protein
MGIWAISSVSLKTAHYPKGTVALAAVSPLFTYFLLRYVRIPYLYSEPAHLTRHRSLASRHLRFAILLPPDAFSCHLAYGVGA